MENQPVPLARLQVSPPKASPGVSGFGWVAKDPQNFRKDDPGPGHDVFF